jgi:hypothetical protein
MFLAGPSRSRILFPCGNNALRVPAILRRRSTCTLTLKANAKHQQQNAAAASSTKVTLSVRRIVKIQAPPGTNQTHNTPTNQPATMMRASHTKVDGCAVTPRS